MEQAQVAAALGTWVASGATFAAVVSAIYLARKGITPKAKFTARCRKMNIVDGKKYYTDDINSPWEKVICLSLTNLNHPLIEIECIKIKIRFYGSSYTLNKNKFSQVRSEGNHRREISLGQTFEVTETLKNFWEEILPKLRQKKLFSPYLLYICVELKNGKKLKASLPKEAVQFFNEAIAADQ